MHEPRPQVPEGPRQVAERPRLLPERGRVHLEAHQLSDGPQHVAEQEARTLGRPEQVADQGKPAALDADVVDGRPADAVDAAVDGGGLHVGVDLLLDRDELPGALEVGDAGSQAGITHRWSGTGAPAYFFDRLGNPVTICMDGTPADPPSPEQEGWMAPREI